MKLAQSGHICSGSYIRSRKFTAVSCFLSLYSFFSAEGTLVKGEWFLNENDSSEIEESFLEGLLVGGFWQFD